MKKVMILVSAIVLTASATTAAYVFSQKSSGLFEANVEALTSGENTSGCTGPKKADIIHGNVFCKCQNPTPCKDLYGCN